MSKDMDNFEKLLQRWRDQPECLPVSCIDAEGIALRMLTLKASQQLLQGPSVNPCGFSFGQSVLFALDLSSNVLIPVIPVSEYRRYILFLLSGYLEHLPRICNSQRR